MSDHARQPVAKPAPAVPTTSALPRPSPGRAARIVRFLSWANLAAMILAAGVLWGVSESTWWGTVMTFSPRQPLLVPAAVLLFCSLLAHRRSLLVNVVSMAVVAGPLMGGRVPLAHLWADEMPSSPPAKARDAELTIVSCNVQVYRPDFDLVLREISDLEPDVVALQEAPWQDERLPRHFAGWHFIHDSQYWIGSRFALRRINTCHATAFQRDTALLVEIETPQGAVRLCDIHLTTARFGLQKLSLSTLRDGSGPKALAQHTQSRLAEAIETRDFAGQGNQALPEIIVGDFNTPSASCVYRMAWRGFINAFDDAGFGFGYTAPCSRRPFWPDYVPWARIDHILANQRWSVSACGVGRGNGSDHRLIWARLSLP